MVVIKLLKRKDDSKYFSVNDWDNVNPENKDKVEQYMAYRGDLSPETRKQYTYNYYMFFSWVYKFAKNQAIYELKNRDVLAYFNWQLAQGISPNTIKTRRSQLSSLFDFLRKYFRDEEEYKYFENIVIDVPAPKGERVHSKEPLSLEQYALLKKTLLERKDWRKLAYVELSYSTGGRREEVRQMRKEIAEAEPIKGEEGLFYKTHDIRAKGSGTLGEVRPLYFGEDAMLAIKEYLKERKEHTTKNNMEDNSEYLFVAYSKKNGTKQVSKGLFNTWCANDFSKILGVRVHPHQLRYTRATHMTVVEKRDMAIAQSLLGHKDIATTQIYVVRDEKDTVKNAF